MLRVPWGSQGTAAPPTRKTASSPISKSKRSKFRVFQASMKDRMMALLPTNCGASGDLRVVGMLASLVAVTPAVGVARQMHDRRREFANFRGARCII